MEALKDSNKPDRGQIITYLATCKEVTCKDVAGVFRFMCSLRLSDTDVQLKLADKIVAWISRFVFVVFMFPNSLHEKRFLKI